MMMHLVRSQRLVNNGLECICDQLVLTRLLSLQFAHTICLVMIHSVHSRQPSKDGRRFGLLHLFFHNVVVLFLWQRNGRGWRMFLHKVGSCDGGHGGNYLRVCLDVLDIDGLLSWQDGCWSSEYLWCTQTGLKLDDRKRKREKV